MWTHYVARDLKPEILENLPSRHEAKADRFNGDIDSDTPANGEAREETPENGAEAEPEKNGDSEEMVNGEEERPSSAGAEPEPLGFAEQQEPQGFAEQQQEEDLAPASELQEEVMAPPLDHCQDSSDLPTETSAAAPEVAEAALEVAREVPVAATNGSSHGTNGVSAALQEVGGFKTLKISRGFQTFVNPDPCLHSRPRSPTTATATPRPPLRGPLTRRSCSPRPRS